MMMVLEGQSKDTVAAILSISNNHYLMQHLYDVVIINMTCRTGLILPFEFLGPLRVVLMQERMYANNAHARGGYFVLHTHPQS